CGAGSGSCWTNAVTMAITRGMYCAAGPSTIASVGWSCWMRESPSRTLAFQGGLDLLEARASVADDCGAGRSWRRRGCQVGLSGRHHGHSARVEVGFGLIEGNLLLGQILLRHGRYGRDGGRSDLLGILS